jgi:pSer/pThr/pTyr-binding forkhead associated (FHA) protein
VEQGKQGSEPDLTKTIHLGSLRSVSDHLLALLDRASQEEREVLSQLPEGSAMLMILSGPAKGSRFLLDSTTTTIGRSASSEILLDDITVSRKHAQIIKVDGSFQFHDQGSLNGSYIDGAVINDAVLTHGMEIQIGKFRLHFFLGGKK